MDEPNPLENWSPDFFPAGSALGMFRSNSSLKPLNDGTILT